MLFGRRKRARRWADGPAPISGLEPLLLDYFTRDGSTLTMRLLATSPQVAVGGGYPYEHKYFAYLYRWARMLEREDWPRNWWSGDSLATLQQEEELPLLGAPPWLPRHLFEPEPQGERFSHFAYRTAWAEFSRRAADQTSRDRGSSPGEVRYYAEKHLNTWQLDPDEVPPFRVVALLRDPRDTYVSINAFRRKREESGKPGAMGRLLGEPEEEWMARHLERQRKRLRWILRAIDEETMPVLRYEDLVRDLPSQAAKLERWFDIQLDPATVASDETMRRTHVTAGSPESSIGRWRREMPPDLVRRFHDELGKELEALGFDVSEPAPTGAAS